MSDFKLKRDEENHLEFDFSIEGDEDISPEIRFSIEAPSGILVFRGKSTDEGVAFDFPALEQIPAGTYRCAIEVILDDRYFKPWKRDIPVEAQIKVSASAKGIKKSNPIKISTKPKEGELSKKVQELKKRVSKIS